MARLLLLLMVCLCLCLLLQDQRNSSDLLDRDEPEAQRAHVVKHLAELASIPQEQLAMLAVAAVPGMGFPACLPWAPLDEVALRQGQAIEKLLRDQPTTFLQMCLDRNYSEVQSYRAVMHKRERLKGSLHALEITEVQFRENPFSVFMNWKQGAGRAQRVLYVDGLENNMMVVRPAGLLGALGTFKRAPDGAEARASGRYLITEFGMTLGTKRTLKAMLDAKARNALFVNYEGIFRVPQAGDRLCYKLVRTPYEPVEEEGVYHLTIYIDLETWLQVGSVLKDRDGKLIAEYFFRDIHINAPFDEVKLRKNL
jgi:hypothetical protein